MKYKPKKHKPNKKWNIWRIKSPWLRLPVAWLFSLVSVIVYAAIIIAGAIIGAVVGIKDGALDAMEATDWRMLWVASTTWRKL